MKPYFNSGKESQNNAASSSGGNVALGRIGHISPRADVCFELDLAREVEVRRADLLVADNIRG